MPAPPAVLEPPQAGRVLLGDADWKTYDRLRDSPEYDGCKLTYDGPAGLLEIERPNGKLHENLSRLVCLLVAVFAEERELDIDPAGSVSLRREDLDRGADCDESFYVSSYGAMHGRDANLLDLAGDDLPPDLVVEIDVTSPGVRKLPILAAMGVAEVWVWRDETLVARRLGPSGRYAVVGASSELPGFPLTFAAELLSRRGGPSPRQLCRDFRDRLRGES